jgi:carbon storage regulator CsrA
MRKGYMAIRPACHHFSSLGTKECTMLVLTRKVMEEICIGNDITVTIVRVKGQTVRVGINAPEHVSVMRSELVSPGVSETDGRERCDENASPDGGSIDDGPSRKQRRDRHSESPSDMAAADAVDADGVVGADGVVDADGAVDAEREHSTSRNVDVASQQPKAIRAHEHGCQARQSPIGSTTAFARVVARRRQCRPNQLFPPR